LAFKQFLNYLSESRAEFEKVVWPTRQEVVGLAVLVVISVAIIGLILVGYDFVIKWVLLVVENFFVGQ
jgi:preprotein translocase subunit SecE